MDIAQSVIIDRFKVIPVEEKQRRLDAWNYAKASVGFEGFQTPDDEEQLAIRFINGFINLDDFISQTLENAQNRVAEIQQNNLSLEDFQEEIEGKCVRMRLVEMRLRHNYANDAAEVDDHITEPLLLTGDDVLTAEEALKQTLIDLQEWGRPFTQEDIDDYVRYYTGKSSLIEAACRCADRANALDDSNDE